MSSYLETARQLRRIADALEPLQESGANPPFAVHLTLSGCPTWSDDEKRSWIELIAATLDRPAAYHLLHDGKTVHYDTERGDPYSGVRTHALLRLETVSDELMAQLRDTSDGRMIVPTDGAE